MRLQSAPNRPLVTPKQFDAFCASLPHTTHVVQWGDASVWKVGGKVFAIGGVLDGTLAVRFKCTPMSYAVLKDQPGCRPAPYLASRGLTWIQRTDDTSMDDAAWKDYLKHSYALVAAGLTKKLRRSLGLEG